MLPAALLLLSAATPGPPMVVSPRAERLSVTVYRDPARGRDNGMNLRSLGGFALVTETRTVRLPRGEAVLRFEGVAGGIVPPSAVVDGLPGGVIEKNRDARLLSPAALIDGSLGRRVTLRRTDPATGAVREEGATIVSGAERGVVLRTATGIEAMRCSGMAESPLFAQIPPDLAARPTLSVRVSSLKARKATLTLSYLASEFDWSASYVATIAADGETLDLFAWLTLANANAEAFPAAETQAVAGRLNREIVARLPVAESAPALRCYPLDTTTSNLPSYGRPSFPEQGQEFGEIMVTAMRAPPAPVITPTAPPPPPPPPEDLGDLKLYRVPERVTIAANGQKQVALIERKGVRFTRIYRVPVYPGQPAEPQPAAILLRIRNDAANGLGIALPAGTTTLYAPRSGRTLLAGRDSIDDTASGETLDLGAGESRQVTVAQEAEAGGTRGRMRVIVRNANPFTIRVEVPIGFPGQPARTHASAPLTRIDGIETWAVDVQANALATLLYN